MSDKKTCSKCGLELDLSEFSFRSKANGTYRAQCKTCQRGAVRIEKTCKFCGKAFAATTNTGDAKKYCSRECSRAANYEGLRSKRAAERDEKLSRLDSQRKQNQEAHPDVFEEFKDLPGSHEEALAQGSKLYFTGLFCKKGHLAPRYTKGRLCLGCNQHWGEVWNEQLKADPVRYAAHRTRSDARKKHLRETDPEWREARNAYSRQYQQENLDYFRDYYRDKRLSDPQFNIRDRIQARINEVLRREGAQRSRTLEEYCGCTGEELMAHLETQFTDGMSWDNRREWNVDHIRPCASFDLTEDEQARLCFNWRNLAPLYAKENFSKSDSYEHHHEVEWARRMRELGYDGELFLLFEEGRGGLYGQEAAGEVDT